LVYCPHGTKPYVQTICASLWPSFNIAKNRTKRNNFLKKTFVCKHALGFKLQILTNSCQTLLWSLMCFNWDFFLFICLCRLKDNTCCLLYQDPLLSPKIYKRNHYTLLHIVPFCDPNIIANNKERCFRNPAVANHNSSQIFKLLRYYNIRTRTIASPSELLNLIQSQNFSD
jgi:hypothetical protein